MGQYPDPARACPETSKSPGFNVHYSLSVLMDYPRAREPKFASTQLKIDISAGKVSVAKRALDTGLHLIPKSEQKAIIGAVTCWRPAAHRRAHPT